MAAKKQEETVDMADRFAEFKELKNIDKTTMISVLEESFRSVLAKMFGTDENFDVIMNPDKGDCEIYQNLEIVNDGEVENPNRQIGLTDARNDKDNAVEQFLADHPESDDWRTYFTEEPEKYRWEEKRQILAAHNDVSLASDAFFPFRDNIDRAHRSGVGYIVQPGGSLRDDLVLEACNQYGMVMVCNSIRLFHH